MSGRAAAELLVGEAREQRAACSVHQSSQGFATRLHGFAAKTKSLAHEISPATQANITLKKAEKKITSLPVVQIGNKNLVAFDVTTQGSILQVISANQYNVKNYANPRRSRGFT